MLGADLVIPIGPYQERTGRRKAPPQEAQQVHRRLIRPLEVLEYDDRRLMVAPEGAQGSVEELVAPATLQQLGDLRP